MQTELITLSCFSTNRGGQLRGDGKKQKSESDYMAGVSNRESMVRGHGFVVAIVSLCSSRLFSCYIGGELERFFPPILYRMDLAYSTSHTHGKEVSLAPQILMHG